MVTPEAALVFQMFGDIPIRVQSDGVPVETATEIWPRLGVGPSQDDWFVLIRPLDGRWRAGAKLSLQWEVGVMSTNAEVVVREGTVESPSPSIDWKGPLVSEPVSLQIPPTSFGPGGPTGQLLTLSGLRSQLGAAVNVLLHFSDGRRVAGALQPGPSHRVELRFDAPVTCIGGELTDAAGNHVCFGGAAGAR